MPFAFKCVFFLGESLFVVKQQRKQTQSYDHGKIKTKLVGF